MLTVNQQTVDILEEGNQTGEHLIDDSDSDKMSPKEKLNLFRNRSRLSMTKKSSILL